MSGSWPRFKTRAIELSKKNSQGIGEFCDLVRDNLPAFKKIIHNGSMESLSQLFEQNRPYFETLLKEHFGSGAWEEQVYEWEPPLNGEQLLTVSTLLREKWTIFEKPIREIWLEREVNKITSSLISSGQVKNYINFLRDNQQYETLAALPACRISLSQQHSCDFPSSLQPYLQQFPP